MSQQSNSPKRKDNPTGDGVAQQPGIHSESSGTSGLTGRNEGEKNVSSGAMDGQGTFGSGQNGPGMKQSSTEKGAENLKKQSEKVEKLKGGLHTRHTGPGDPATAQDGLI